MGIDIYATWQGMTDAQHQKQICGFSIDNGHAGYLREAYHGGPYATKVLVPEAFETEGKEAVPIAAAFLKARLPETLKVAIARQAKIYHEDADSEDMRLVCQSFTDFVELCARKEAANGEPCRVFASW